MSDGAQPARMGRCQSCRIGMVYLYGDGRTTCTHAPCTAPAAVPDLSKSSPYEQQCWCEGCVEEGGGNKRAFSMQLQTSMVGRLAMLSLPDEDEPVRAEIVTASHIKVGDLIGVEYTLLDHATGRLHQRSQHEFTILLARVQPVQRVAQNAPHAVASTLPASEVCDSLHPVLGLKCFAVLGHGGAHHHRGTRWGE